MVYTSKGDVVALYGYTTRKLGKQHGVLKIQVNLEEIHLLSFGPSSFLTDSSDTPFRHALKSISMF